ncbi:galectin 17 [Scophthalmus maximus]|uniref:galectin 17 n=1 Tax=Scophthalmus maximus TaxID=52904 RepID=UPI001FA93406|nr:galectin 17 [Scophthalmus maximus]
MTSSEKLWWFVLHRCFLIGSLVDSSSLAATTHFLSVTSTVGERAVLPCSWSSRLRSAAAAAASNCHIQWQTTASDTVFEKRGPQRWQAAEFEGRVEVPEEQLGHGDCSLVISDVQIGDTGRYESFMVVDGERSGKTRVFIQGVRLSVFDHKSRQAQGPGGELVLDLHTRHSVRVVFQGRNSSVWSTLWIKDDDESSGRMQKHPERQQLIMKNLERSDEGTYKVLDKHGLSISTVQLAVEGSPEVQTRVGSEVSAAGDASRSSRSSDLLVTSALVTSFLIIRLL